MTEVARLAIRHGVAAMYDESAFVEMGGLMTFKMYHENRIQRIAAMVTKGFRGIKPAEIPWELPDRSQIAINMSTAKALGLSIPSDVLRARTSSSIDPKRDEDLDHETTASRNISGSSG
jgi:putative ABC transport system substrate-binding protein